MKKWKIVLVFLALLIVWTLWMMVLLPYLKILQDRDNLPPLSAIAGEGLIPFAELYQDQVYLQYGSGMQVSAWTLVENTQTAREICNLCSRITGNRPFTAEDLLLGAPDNWETILLFAQDGWYSVSLPPVEEPSKIVFSKESLSREGEQVEEWKWIGSLSSEELARLTSLITVYDQLHSSLQPIVWQKSTEGLRQVRFSLQNGFSQDQLTQINWLFLFVQSHAAMYGLENVDFSNLCLAQPLSAYFYTQEGVWKEVTDLYYYPVLEGENWVATLIEFPSADAWKKDTNFLLSW